MDSEAGVTQDSILVKNDARKIFRKKGTCSQTFTYLLNREFGHTNRAEELAADPLAGGIMQKGQQCGMLWGSSLAVGAESYRRFDNKDQAIAVAIRATQYLMNSFSNIENTVDCREVTRCDWNNKLSMAKYFFSGRFLHCFRLAQKWAPQAVESAMKGLSEDKNDQPEKSISCASEVARKMGATDEEMVMVAGFAGGLGLSGKGCGALSAAIWINTLNFYKDYTGDPVYLNPNAKKTLMAFEAETDSKILCQEICGKQFDTLADHTEFIENGGCDKLIRELANS